MVGPANDLNFGMKGINGRPPANEIKIWWVRGIKKGV